jgi:hypothetical protein
MKSRQISRFGQVAKILNRENSIVVDPLGVEGNVSSDVKAAWYLGKEGGYQRRITAPGLVDPLLAITGELRMRLFILKPRDLQGAYYLACLIGRDKNFGFGYYRLDIAGLTHDQEVALPIIKQAAREAKGNYQAGISIWVRDKHYPTMVEIRDSLLA